MSRTKGFFFAFGVLCLISACGAGTDATSTPSIVTTNVESGDLEVSTRKNFFVTFTAPVKLETVTTESFFLTTTTPTAVIASKALVNAAVCDPSLAVPATLTCASETECTLTPLETLDTNTTYRLCLTSRIEFEEPELHGVFQGTILEFTTKTADADAVESVGDALDANDFTFAVGDSASSVTESFTLPTSGVEDTVITWTSGNTDVVSTTGDSAAVTRPTTDTTVTLTATITKGEASNTKEVSVVVLGTSLGASNDTTAPTVTITSAESTLTAESPFTATLTFSEDISGLELSDLTATNATVANLQTTTANRVFTVSVTPSASPSDITLTIPAGGVVDGASNANTVSNVFSIRYDTSALTVAMTSSAGSSTNASPFSATITFSEAVAGFVLADIGVTNGAAGALTSSDDRVFTANITPSANGAVMVSVAAGVATDAFSQTKSNTATSALSTVYDGTAPTVDSTVPADAASAVAITSTVAVVFSEAMDTSTLTTNTTDTTCSGSLQVSSDSFSTCVRMAAAPVATNGNKTFTVTPNASLSHAATYKIRITTAAKDAAGNAIAAAVTTETGFTTASKMIFITAATYTGNLGGISGADAKCMADANYPGTGTYKALLSDGVARTACTTADCGGGSGEHTDWVLSASTNYVRADGSTSIVTTNANGIFVFGTMTNSWQSGAQVLSWSGTYYNWTAFIDCSNWSSASGSAFGLLGRSDATNSEAISNAATDCSQTKALVCVEQ